MCQEGYHFLYEKGKNNTLVCVFGAGIRQLGQTLETLPAHKAFCSDKTWMWWHCPKVFEGIKKNLKETFAKVKPKRTVFFGTSMGCLGAVEYATIFPCDEVVLFSPQVYPEKHFMTDGAAHGYWPDKKMAVMESMQPYKNATTMLRNDIPYTVYCSDAHEIDLHHTSLIPDQSNIKKIFVNSPNHNSAGALKNQNKLSPIIWGHTKGTI